MPGTKTLMTANELLKMPEDGYRYELIQGELKKMSPGGEKHGAAIAKFTGYLAFHVYENELGTVCGAETGYKIKENPDDVKAPDVSFTSKSRIQEENLIDQYSTIPPDLVVEVTSPSDYPKKVQEKIDMWLAFGVSLVITINPINRTVSLNRLNSSVTLTENDILDLDDIVPNFSYPISKLLLKKKI